MKAPRILVVRLGAMGDIIHTLPAVASVKQSFPHSHIAWAVEERWMPLLEGNPFIDERIGVRKRNLPNFLALRKRLRAKRFDIAIDFQGLIKSAITANLARPDRIFGFHRSQARESLAALFYSSAIKTTATHVVDQYAELAAGAGATAIARSFFIPEGKPEGGVLPSGDFILANPLAGWGSKQWPLESYLQLAKRMDLPLVLNVPNAIEAPGAHVHVSGLPGLIDATRRAAAVIGVDSGPLHLAAALGKPGVAIFGPTDPSRNGPYGGSLTVLRSSTAETTYKRTTDTASSMQSITVDEVLAALTHALSKAVR
ncbi:MAG TPA: glycosyltransferase family 9 protein [Bryobacteraceae bacterium]|nr:glycosyltransferase family 9 protein [Bryobacteraceae bacterium]